MAVAQNWSPINTEETFYFEAGVNELTGIRVDSIAILEGNTVWYTNLLVELHPELQFNPIMCSEFDAEGAILRAGFMQFEIHSPEPGVYRFQNPDTFEIHTQAAVGSEWVYSELYDEDVITATVTAAVNTEVLGEADSVKTISLSDGRSIVLSKNHGLVEFESSNGDTHVLSGIADRQLGTYPVGRHEVYDFSPGDVFVYLEQGGYSEEYSKALIRIEIDAVVENGDEIEIEYNRTSHRRIWEMTEVDQGIFIPTEIDPQITHETEVMYSFNTSNRHISDVVPNTAFNKFSNELVVHPFFVDFPEEYPEFNRYVYSGEVNGRATKEVGGSSALSESYIAAAEQFGELSQSPVQEEGIIYYHFMDSSDFGFTDAPILLNDTAVFTQSFIGCPETYEYFAFGEGLGVISHQIFNSLSGGEQTMVGYRKGEEEYGFVPTSAEVLSVGIEENETLLVVTVYPVPTIDELYLTHHEAQSFRIFDMSGKPVLQGSLSGTSAIDVSNLAAGLYNGHILRANQPEGQFRFVKR